MIQLYSVFSLSLSRSCLTSAHLVCKMSCSMLIQDFHSHFGRVDRIVTCLIGSLLHRHKNLEFARLFKPIGTRALQRQFKAERSQSHPKPPHEYHRVIFHSLLLSLSGQVHTKLCKNCRPGDYPRKHSQFSIYAHYRSEQTSFIGARGGGSAKMRCRIGFRRCRIRIRLVPAQIKP